MKFAWLEEAFADYSQAALRYETQSPNLGLSFTNEVDSGIERMTANPLIFSATHDGYRKVRLKKFPFSLIFRFEGEAIVLIAIAHQHQDASAWRQRL